MYILQYVTYYQRRHITSPIFLWTNHDRYHTYDDAYAEMCRTAKLWQQFPSSLYIFRVIGP